MSRLDDDGNPDKDWEGFQRKAHEQREHPTPGSLDQLRSRKSTIIILMTIVIGGPVAFFLAVFWLFDLLVDAIW